MSQLVLATADVEFEDRVRDAFDGELEGQVRYWRDGLVDDPAQMLTDISGMPTHVVAIGPDVPSEMRLRRTRREALRDRRTIPFRRPSAPGDRPHRLAARPA